MTITAGAQGVTWSLLQASVPVPFQRLVFSQSYFVTIRPGFGPRWIQIGRNRGQGEIPAGKFKTLPEKPGQGKE